jgi:hypothetical protein
LQKKDKKNIPMKVALFLGNYYSKIAVDKKLSEYWYRIGVQNGSHECKYIFGKILSEKDNRFDKIRGKFWLDRVVADL